MSTVFKFKQFDLYQSEKVFKLTTDATLLAALFEFPKESILRLKGLEIGIGTGVVSMMLAQRFPHLYLHGIDINPTAVELAKRNILRSPFASRIEVSESDFLSWKTIEPYDVIVTNPPYFDNSTISSKSEEEAFSRHQIGLSYRDLVVRSSKMLREGGVFQMIFPCRYEDQLRAIFSTTDLLPVKSVYIKHHKNAKPKNMIISAIRISLGFEVSNQPETITNFNLRTVNGEFSDQYKLVLKDFLLAF